MYSASAYPIRLPVEPAAETAGITDCRVGLNAKPGGMPQGSVCTFSGKTCIFCSRLALRKANSLVQLPKASTNFLALRLPHCPSSSGRRWRQPCTSSEIAKDMKAAYSVTGLFLVAIGIISGSVMQRGKIDGSDKRSGEAAF
jgi:hypothetical protein